MPRSTHPKRGNYQFPRDRSSLSWVPGRVHLVSEVNVGHVRLQCGQELQHFGHLSSGDILGPGREAQNIFSSKAKGSWVPNLLVDECSYWTTTPGLDCQIMPEHF